MDLVVRPLAARDVEQVASLEATARASLLGLRGGPAHLAERPAVEHWTELLDSDRRAAWVATIDDVVVGYLELHRQVRDIAEVMQVYVEPQARELGAGEYLLAAALQRAREWGCDTIEGTALPGDRETKNLYERAGITARRIIVSRRIDG